MYMITFLDKNGVIKLEFRHLKDQGFTDILEMPEFDDEIIQYVLSRVHGEFIWLDRPHKITKNVIRAITDLPQVGQRLDKKKISNNEVTKLTGATFDNRSMRISTIRDKDVQFASMVIGYKVNQSNRLNYVSSSYIYCVHKMIKENENYDLFQWMCDELILNLGKIKGEKKGVFRYGNLVVCLMLFFLNETPGSGKRQWAFNILVGKQIKDGLRNLGQDKESTLWGYFKAFQKAMKQRERVPKHIIDKYSIEICFMVKKDENLMEFVQPRIVWVTEMGYEVDAQVLDLYAKMLIDALVDEMEKTCDTAKQKELEVQIGFNKKKREGQIKKVGQAVKKMSSKIK